MEFQGCFASLAAAHLHRVAEAAVGLARAAGAALHGDVVRPELPPLLQVRPEV